MKECITKAVEKLEWMGWSKDSVKGIGKFSSTSHDVNLSLHIQELPINVRRLSVGPARQANHSAML